MAATFKSEVRKANSEFKKETDKLFRAFNSEVKKKKLTAISDTNKLWNKSYKSRLDKIEAKHDEIYKNLWLKYFPK